MPDTVHSFGGRDVQRNHDPGIEGLEKVTLDVQ